MVADGLEPGKNLHHTNGCSTTAFQGLPIRSGRTTKLTLTEFYTDVVGWANEGDA